MKKVERIRCEFCGRFISYKDLDEGKAIHRLVTPDSHLTRVEFESFCVKCLDNWNW
ncbi:MAG: hypothetical protein ACTSSP_07245 [Candidatus Asgardarchaeia archaeon]